MSARRRPNVARARRKRNVKALLRALEARDVIVDEAGHRIDLAVPSRVEAVRGLGELPDEGEGVDEALARALDDPDPRVVAAALAVVSARPTPEATHALARGVIAWKEPEHLELREAALAYLRAREDPRIAVEVADALRTDDSAEDLSAYDERAVSELFAVPGGSDAAAAFAPRLMSALSGEDTAARRRARGLLVACGPGVVDLLLQALEDPAARGDAAEILGGLRQRRAIPGLTHVLRSAAPGAERARAAAALGAIRHPDATEALAEATMDDDPGVRDAAYDALDRLGTAGVLAGVAAVLEAWARQHDLPRNGDATGGTTRPSPLQGLLRAR